MFRPAVDDDWPGIWEVFQSVVATGDTYPYPPEILESEARSVWMSPSHDVSVAQIDEEIVGTAYLKPNLPGLGDHVANAGWMIAPRSQGRGIGRPFAGYVLDRARAAGYRGMQFNAVVSTNTGAIALWRSLGFEIIGTVPRAFRHPSEGFVPIHVMYRDL